MGAGESGKSTFLKQMRIIHGVKFEAELMREYQHVIYQNVVKGTSASYSTGNCLSLILIRFLFRHASAGGRSRQIRDSLWASQYPASGQSSHTLSRRQRSGHRNVPPIRSHSAPPLARLFHSEGLRPSKRIPTCKWKLCYSSIHSNSCNYWFLITFNYFMMLFLFVEWFR